MINFEDSSLNKRLVVFNGLLKERNISKIRSFLDDNLAWHSNEEKFILYCLEEASRIDGVFEGAIGFEKTQMNVWDRDYLYTLQSNQFSNYSLERYIHIANVQNYLDSVESGNVEFKSIEKPKNTPVKVGTVGKCKEKPVNFYHAVGIVTVAAVSTSVLLLLKKIRKKM